MEINKIRKIYFSPTGTTKKVIDEMSQSLLVYDFTLPEKRKSFPEVEPGDLVLFGVPTYAGRVPNVLLKYLQTIEGNDALAVPIVTFGNRNFDNSLIELRDILESAGFHTVAAAAVSCEHSFSYTLGAGRPDDDDVEEIHRFAARLAEKIRELKEIPAPIEVPGVLENYGDYYQPQDRKGAHIDIRKVFPKVNDSCICCNLCAQVCPMGSIVPHDVRQMQGICIKCGACYKKCPASARYFDHEGYIYHKKELESLYQRRADNKFFL